jgi:hypothetical protein
MDGADDVIFFGGTALSRTFLPTLRLSEDIDLLVHGRRSDVAARIGARSRAACVGPTGRAPGCRD